MKNLWLWVREPLNLAVLVAIGSGLAWLWANVGTQKKSESAPFQRAQAECGLAVNATGKAIVQIGGQPAAPDCLPSQSAPTPMPSAGGQQAEAAAGSIAVNAADGSEVKVQTVPERMP